MKYETSALIWIFDLLHKSTSKKNLLKRERESILDLGAIGQYCSYSTRMSSVILESLLESWFIITHVLDKQTKENAIHKRSTSTETKSSTAFQVTQT